VNRHTHVHLEGTVAVPLTQPNAFELFTPSGEREWAEGWDPSFPACVQDETNPGTVFLTGHHQHVTWVVASCDRPRSITYANVAEHRASLVRVSCQPNPDGTTTATASYDMTALSDDGNAALHEFAAHYQRYLRHWQDAIATAVTTPCEPGIHARPERDRSVRSTGLHAPQKEREQ